MKILFLHPNFPAQFQHLALKAATIGHDVKFLCQTHYGRELKGVDRLTLKKEASYEELNRKDQVILERTVTLASQYRQGFYAIKNAGWTPDLVISHSGWGCGTFVKEIWPKCKQISYLEWWFNPESSFYTYDKTNKNLQSIHTSLEKQWLRNQSLSLELCVSDLIVTPTQWQRDQLPNSLKSRSNIIFDGVDLTRFQAITTKKDIRKNLITYGTRGMDPIRCFPQFIKSIPSLLHDMPELQIEIAGIDEAFYGSTKTLDGLSWGKWAQTFLHNQGCHDNVSWIGRLRPGIYEEWIKRSSCHVYLTHPFVASWSLVESYCCGTPLVVSDVLPTQEICEPSDSVIFVDHRKENLISSAIKESLQKFEFTSRTSTALARRVERYGNERAWNQWKDVADL